ncbi:MAG: MATE family efflux transporter [[Clostridium] scindens]
MGASAGAGVVISQFFGARDKEGVRKAVHTMIAIAMGAGIILTAAGILPARQPGHGDAGRYSGRRSLIFKCISRNSFFRHSTVRRDSQCGGEFQTIPAVLDDRCNLQYLSGSSVRGGA